MATQKQNNGFTLLEALIVLIIVCVCSISIGAHPNRLSLFMRQLQNQCILAQEKAYTDKRDITLSFSESGSTIDDVYTSYPHGIHCTAIRFHYNPKGNISQGNTVTCSYNHHQKKLIFQLGQGRVRIE